MSPENQRADQTINVEKINHTGNLPPDEGQELPVKLYNTPLEQAHEEGLIGDAPGDPSALTETLAPDNTPALPTRAPSLELASETDEDKKKRERDQMRQRLAAEAADETADVAPIETQSHGLMAFLRTGKGKAMATAAGILLAAGAVTTAVSATNQETAPVSPETSASKEAQDYRDIMIGQIEKMPLDDFFKEAPAMQRSQAYLMLTSPKYQKLYETYYGGKNPNPDKVTYKEASLTDTNQQILDDLAYCIQLSYLPETTASGTASSHYDNVIGSKFISLVARVNGDPNITGQNPNAPKFLAQRAARAQANLPGGTVQGARSIAVRPDDVLPLINGSTADGSPMKYKDIPVTVNGQVQNVPVYMRTFPGPDDTPRTIWTTQ